MTPREAVLRQVVRGRRGSTGHRPATAVGVAGPASGRTVSWPFFTRPQQLRSHLKKVKCLSRVCKRREKQLKLLGHELELPNTFCQDVPSSLYQTEGEQGLLGHPSGYPVCSQGAENLGVSHC